MSSDPPDSDDPSSAAAPLEYESSRKSKDGSSRFTLQFSFAEFLIVCVIIAVLIGLLLPTFRTHGRGYDRKRVQCISQLRQLNTSLQQYATQYRVYPSALNGLTAMGCPPGLMACPASTTGAAYVYLIGGAKIGTLNPVMVVAYEPLGNHGTAAEPYACVLFADGHAIVLPGPVITQMIKELNAGQNPPPATAGK